MRGPSSYGCVGSLTLEGEERGGLDGWSRKRRKRERRERRWEGGYTLQFVRLMKMAVRKAFFFMFW